MEVTVSRGGGGGLQGVGVCKGEGGYLDAVHALGGTTGQRISRPRIHRPLADGLFDCESSEEDPELQAGRLPIGYPSAVLRQPDLARRTNTRGNTRCNAYPPARAECTRGIYYTGHPTTRRWYTDGSKHHGRAGENISNGDFRAAFWVHGPQQVYRVETMACAPASDSTTRG